METRKKKIVKPISVLQTALLSIMAVIFVPFSKLFEEDVSEHYGKGSPTLFTIFFAIILLIFVVASLKLYDLIDMKEADKRTIERKRALLIGTILYVGLYILFYHHLQNK